MGIHMQQAISSYLFLLSICAANWRRHQHEYRQRDKAAKPSVFAVLRLMMNSNFVAWSTGKSLGFTPLSMRPV
jgi:hypothetical protein